MELLVTTVTSLQAPRGLVPQRGAAKGESLGVQPAGYLNQEEDGGVALGDGRLVVTLLGAFLPVKLRRLKREVELGGLETAGWPWTSSV